MEKEFIPYQTALELKELGFDEPCIKYYWTDGMFSKGYENPFNYNKRDNVISAPTFSQAFRWFREKYKLHPKFNIDVKGWFFTISSFTEKGSCTTNTKFAPLAEQDYKTYEEAELACLIKLIEIAKNSK